MDMQAVWLGLVEDADLPLWVVDVNGTVEFATAAAVKELAGGRTVIGRPLADIFPALMAEERVSLITRVCETGRPILLIEMIRGRWSRTVMRRLCEAPQPKVLIISRLGWCPNQSARADESERYDIAEPKHHDTGLLGRLSKREIEVLALIGEGLSTNEIASRLGRTAKTVEWHRCALGKKLNIHSKLELAKLANSAGLRSVSAPAYAAAPLSTPRHPAFALGRTRPNSLTISSKSRPDSGSDSGLDSRSNSRFDSHATANPLSDSHSIADTALSRPFLAAPHSDLHTEPKSIKRHVQLGLSK